MAKQDDVSKKTVLVLATLVILVTIFSTWAVLTATSVPVVRSTGEAKGLVMLQIAGDTPQSTAPPATANVALTVEAP